MLNLLRKTNALMPQYKYLANYLPPSPARHRKLHEEFGVLEDEIHFLSICTKFSDKISTLYQKIMNVAPNFENIECLAKYVLLLSQDDMGPYGVVVCMFDFHRSDRGSNPGRGGKISYCFDYTIDQHPWQVSENHKPRVHPSHVREIG